MTKPTRRLWTLPAATLAAACVFACPPGPARAQAEKPQTRQPSPSEIFDPVEPHKFDEFGDVPASDIAARLDAYANEMQSNPTVKGFVIAYRSRRDLPGLSGRLAALLRSYLLHTRQLPPERVVAVDGGEAGCLAQELWIVPPGAAPVPRPDAYRNEFEDTDATRKFDEAPLHAESSYHQHFIHSLEGFAAALRREPRARGHLIGYDGYWVSREEDAGGGVRTRRAVYADPPGTAARQMRKFKARLVREYGIAPSRVTLVSGGHRKWGQVELWIVPPTGHTPRPTPTEFPRGRRG